MKRLQSPAEAQKKIDKSFPKRADLGNRLLRHRAAPAWPTPGHPARSPAPRARAGWAGEMMVLRQANFLELAAAGISAMHFRRHEHASGPTHR
jgi:hypothetical protein